MGEGRRSRGGRRTAPFRPLPLSPLPSPQWPASRQRRSARVTRPGLLAPSRAERSPPAHGPGRGRRAALRRAARSRGAAAVALAVRTSPPARGARAHRPPSPSRLAGGGAVLPGRPRRSLELGGAWQSGPAEARGAGRRRRYRRRRCEGHDRGAERAAAERGAEGEAKPRAGAARPRSSF